MSLYDLLDKKVVYDLDLSDEYYWSNKLIIDVDDTHYCLINYDDSYSGYIPFSMESVDECFLSAFMNDICIDEDNYFREADYKLKSFVNDQDYYEYLKTQNAILIEKEKVKQYLNK